MGRKGKKESRRVRKQKQRQWETAAIAESSSSKDPNNEKTDESNVKAVEVIDKEVGRVDSPNSCPQTSSDTKASMSRNKRTQKLMDDDQSSSSSKDSNNGKKIKPKHKATEIPRQDSPISSLHTWDSFKESLKEASRGSPTLSTPTQATISDSKRTAESVESENKELNNEILFSDVIQTDFKLPRKRKKVPTIYLHRPNDFTEHAENLLVRGVKFYQPTLFKNYTKIDSQTLTDHSLMIDYFKENNLMFHSYSPPGEKWLKYVIRGLPLNTSIPRLKSELRAHSIPILRMHAMYMKASRFDQLTCFILVVVPLKPETEKLLHVKTIFGHKVKIELPHRKASQCYRCQKWGHCERYCQGQIKCVKCAGHHLTRDCKRDPKDPLKCANCEQDHAASHRHCSYCPDSHAFKSSQFVKEQMRRLDLSNQIKPKIVTFDHNASNLYINSRFRRY